MLALLDLLLALLGSEPQEPDPEPQTAPVIIHDG